VIPWEPQLSLTVELADLMMDFEARVHLTEENQECWPLRSLSALHK